MRTPTSRPMRPSPRMASVLPYSSEPEYSFRSQRPSFMLVAAGQMGRASAPIRKHVSSHAEIELPPGVLFGRGKRNGKHQHVVSRRCFDVDVVHAGTGTSDRLHPAGARVQNLGRNFRVRPHDESIIILSQ
uniref:Uncharacterized protein n=1 Tax=Anopheles coluzzii TaxID=1518534 RepID=A0A8W7PRT5_ANOCL